MFSWIEYCIKYRNLLQVQKFASSIEFLYFGYSILYTNILSTEILYLMQISVLDAIFYDPKYRNSILVDVLDDKF